MTTLVIRDDLQISEGSGNEPHEGRQHRDEAEPRLHVALRLLEQAHLYRNHPLHHYHGKLENH